MEPNVKLYNLAQGFSEKQAIFAIPSKIVEDTEIMEVKELGTWHILSCCFWMK